MCFSRILLVLSVLGSPPLLLALYLRPLGGGVRPGRLLLLNLSLQPARAIHHVDGKWANRRDNTVHLCGSGRRRLGRIPSEAKDYLSCSCQSLRSKYWEGKRHEVELTAEARESWEVSPAPAERGDTSD